MRYALIVGIDKYKDPRNNLRGCVNDAKDFHKTLLSFGYSEIVNLYNKSATHQNIQEKLENMISKLKPGDKFVYYHSGHGVQLLDNDNDENDGYDEALVCYDFDFDNQIQFTDDVLRDCLKKQPNNTLVSLVFDTCYSAGFADDIKTGDRKSIILNNLETKNSPRKIKKLGVHQKGVSFQRHLLVSGSKESQYSYETSIKNKIRGMMTEAFTRNLRKNRKHTWNSLVSQVSSEISESTRKNQIPQIIGPNWIKKRRVFC